MVLLAVSKPARAISPFLPVLSVAAALAVTFVAATLPTPLYAVYRRTFGFSEITLTLIYAVYVLGNLGALFLGGRSSDQIGRKISVLAGMAAGFASTLVFIFAAGTAWLFLARTLSGFATGLVSGAATAWIVELQPGNNKAAGAATACAANFVGLAVGPLLAGLLAQFAPGALRLSWIVYLVMLNIAVLPTLVTPETVKAPVRRLRELSLEPRLGVPEGIRLQFLSPAVTAFVVFALIGFYAALIPGLILDILHRPSATISGLVVSGLFVVAAAAVALTLNAESRKSMLWGLAMLLPGLMLLVAAELIGSMTVLILAAAFGGIAAALGYRGSLELVSRIAPEDQRAEVVSSYLIAVYAGNSLPVIGVGVLSSLADSLAAHIVFAALIGLLAIGALATGMKYAPNR